MTFLPAWLVLSLLPAQLPPQPRLVEGKFGKALDAASTPLAFGGDQRYRTPPLTVECWARLNGKRGFNVLVSSDTKSSARHWELYTYAGSGRLSAYLPGYTPAEIISPLDVCDRQWHHLAMTFDGRRVTLFADGKQVHAQEVKPRPGLKPLDGPLSVGQAIEGDTRIGCDGLIDEVRLSRILRKIDRVPTQPLAVDADTTSVWRFDGADVILADPAWTPPPSVAGEPWERETDVDWVDARLRKMDTGPTFQGTFRYPAGKEQITVYKGTAIRIGDRGQGGILFDRAQLRFAAAWTGGYLQHSDRRFGLLNTPTPAGKLVHAASQPSSTAPLPPEQGRYQGLFLHGPRAVLAYSLQGINLLESPWLETLDGHALITRTIQVGPSTQPITLPLGRPLGVQLHGGTDDASFAISTTPHGQQVRIEPSPRPRRFRVVYGTVPEQQRGKILADLSRQTPVADLTPLTRPGSLRWKPLTTRGTLAPSTAPYVVDTLTIPYDNPYHALFFTSGHDFLPDGRIAVCTAHGDVWLVAADEKLQRVTWRRFATGLYHPLGLKVMDGKVVVLERGQLTRLHDSNDDGEADRYENLCHAWHTGSGEHSYDTCLETDSAGNFYFFKTGDTHLPHGGCLMRVSPDGKKVEVFSTGFRHPIGLGVSPTDVVTGADQEGNWMPVTRLDLYKRGGFYGDMRAHHRPVAPSTYDGPLVWLPKSVDNSAGGQVWVPHDQFGLPRGQMLHFSYGRCKLYAILPQKIGDVDQAGAVDLGVKFLSGSARGRFHPRDGFLYVTGLRGWQTGAQRDGCLQRVRYTGQPLPFPVGLAVFTDGIRVDFAQPLAASAADPKRFSLTQWNYQWTANYGSKNWSVRHPDREGKDALPVEAVTRSDDGRSLFLRVPGLGPVMQMRIGYDLPTPVGGRLQGEIHHTIHKLAPARPNQEKR